MKELTIEDGVRMTLERYRVMLVDKGIKAKNLVDTNPYCLEHALWMVLTTQKGMKSGPDKWAFDKTNRWVGFVQCLLGIHKLTTVNAERDVTRPWLSKSQNSPT